MPYERVRLSPLHNIYSLQDTHLSPVHTLHGYIDDRATHHPEHHHMSSTPVSFPSLSVTTTINTLVLHYLQDIMVSEAPCKRTLIGLLPSSRLLSLLSYSCLLQNVLFPPISFLFFSCYYSHIFVKEDMFSVLFVNVAVGLRKI